MPGVEDHISALLGTQGQPEINDQGMDDGLDTEIPDGGGEQPAAVVQEPSNEEPPAGGRRKKNVPLTALQEERAKRQELQDQYNNERQRNDRAEQRLQQMMQLFQQQTQQPQQQQQEPEPQIPNFVDDPEGHVNGLRQQFERQLAQLQQHTQQQQQAVQANQQGQQIAAMAAKAEEEFKAVTPDYLPAADFFLKRKQAEYAAFGLDPVTLQAQVQRDYQGLVLASLQRNMNPAQVLYNMAKAMGYTAQPVQPQGQRQAPQSRPVAPTSLSDIGGAPRAPDEEGDLTADALAEMSDAEFDKFWNKMSRQNRVTPKF